MALDKNYSPDFSAGSTYTTDSPLSIDPDSIGASDGSPSFVVPVTGGGTTITDYVPASTGGTFSGLVSYNNAKTLSGDLNFTYKSWVENAISAAITSGAFTTLFNTLYTSSDLADLSVKKHNDLTDFQGGESGQYYHLNATWATNASRYATALVPGILSNTDWNTFNSKLSSVTAGTGITVAGGSVISAYAPGIDHDSLNNFVEAEHIPLNDAQTTTGYVWSASKIISYVATQIPATITDYVSKASGGTFSGTISYNDEKSITTNFQIPHKKYVDDAITTALTDYATDTDVSDAIAAISIAHSSTTGLQGGTTAQYYHLTSAQHTIATKSANASRDGYLTAAKYRDFDAKLDSFSVAASGSPATFLEFTGGVLYWNPAQLDHDALLNYEADEHTPLDDTLTTDANVWSAEKIVSIAGTIYTVTLGTGTSLSTSERLDSTKGLVVPSGWTLTNPTGNDLLITHNLDKKLKSISIWVVEGDTDDTVKLEGTIGYTTCTNTYTGAGYNAVTLTDINCSAAFAGKKLDIQLIF